MRGEGMMASWPPPQREDRFKIGDKIWWHVPTVMDWCNSWAPPLDKPVTVIAVKDKKNSSHTQLVRITPNYCPWGDEFGGEWFLPVGIKSHNDKAYTGRPDVKRLREWKHERERERWGR
jgi:hypothetical protein